MRFLLGPACDKYGARVLMAVILCAASIPTACTGLIQTATGLAILRTFIGIAGGTFVMCQFWSSRMFTKEVVGTANALVGGWGNLGGGVTQLVMGAGLFPLFKIIFDGDSEKAWRTVCVIPAVVAFASGIIIYYISDDAPKGNYADLKKHGTMAEVSAAASFRSGACNVNTWLLFIQYGCCFGVELTMNNAAALYFSEQFDQSTESAAAIASIFGWMNLFARGLGGVTSDWASSKIGLKGRLWTQFILLLLEGALVLVFANSSTLAGSIVVMVFFSLFVQAAEGSTYGIVPYVDPTSTGSISGIVGAGGNTGAVCFGLGFRQLDSDKAALTVMGATILGASFLSMLIVLKGHAGIIFGEDGPEAQKAIQTLVVPEPDAEKADDVNEEDC
jgi:NNP family nitrate/nitrite transporter-like MFS transporter